MPSKKAGFTLPGLPAGTGEKVASVLQDRLVSLIDLGLTLKHVHWNVVGPHFIAVHEMIDPQVEAVHAMADATAERIAALGASPNGLPGHIVKVRPWDDYALQRATVLEHLGALEVVYRGIIESHREALDALEKLDPVSQDMVIGQTRELEQFHWFVRAHLESASGELSTQGSTSERDAAAKANRTG